MHRRTPAETVAANITATSLARGLSIRNLSDAAGVSDLKLVGAADQRPELLWGEIQDISGVLSASPVDFFREVRLA